ncbi:hypothetical protein [Kibdelosporangium phytohabitans]|uniref:DUF7847 domain-containing protein n=1 Tax=Kibdelosporangium phytohabitans TaxID=860235 RepID=A0A0N9HZS5_9PSEU|nr:hypothetical protein [Kibdelosporangium phytohabitans]ALG07396.1 hypothetical protein AOZ06_11100 [Kibdelosporangium phytohabitans]MBE1471721.1 hypothetical protein [Kibdelosporangium phytohabitans]
MTENEGWSSPDDKSGRSQDPAPGPQQPYQQQPYPRQPHPQQPYPAAPPPQWGPRAAKPGVIPLRPLGLGEILDGAISAIRAYPKQMLGMSAIAATISNLLGIGLMIFIVNETTLLHSDLPLTASEADRAVDDLQRVLTLTAPTTIITVLIAMVVNGVLTVVMGKAVLGQPITVGEAWSHIRPRFFALLGLSVLYTLIVAAGTIAFVIPGIWLYILFGLSSTALILEGAKVGTALTRSRRLVSGAWWRTFGILLLALIMVSLITQIVQIPFSLASGDFYNATGVGLAPDFEVAMLLTAIAGIIAQTITMPFTAGVTTLIYVDRRMRREGMDIELARQAGVSQPPPQPPTTW